MFSAMKKLLIEPTDSTSLQLLRTIIIGFISLAVDMGVIVSLTESGTWYIVSAAVGFCVSLVVNWALNRLFVFRSCKLLLRVELAAYALLSVIGLVLTECVMYVLVDFVGAPYPLAKLVAAAVVLIWTFTARKKLVYR